MDRRSRRILDAAGNRAREACRTLEDIARFALDDAPAVARLKALRHELTDALRALPGGDSALLASRDAASDVGADISTPGELARGSLRDVALAAASRLTEALRTLEECAKVMERSANPAPPAPLPQGEGSTEPPPSGRGLGEGQRDDSARAAIERLRVRAYDISRDVALALGVHRDRCAAWRLCVILTESTCQRPWLDVARAALDAGADCLQLREKSLPDCELLARARALVNLAQPAGASVIVNDRPDIALLAGAAGVHVGQRDLAVRDIRALAGDDLIVGVSVASLEQARAARQAGADYIGVGAMFDTATKPKDAIAGPQLLRECLAMDPPAPSVLAIGGVSPDNLAQLLDAAQGAPFGVAVCAAVCAASDPAGACRSLLRALTSADTGSADASDAERTSTPCPYASSTPHSTTA